MLLWGLRVLAVRVECGSHFNIADPSVSCAAISFSFTTKDRLLSRQEMSAHIQVESSRNVMAHGRHGKGREGK